MHHGVSPSKNWVAQYKLGDFSTCDAPHPGRPKTMTTPEIIDQIHELTFEDHRISAKLIAEQPVISRERVGSIIHEDLDMWKLSTKLAPKCLNADQKRQAKWHSLQNGSRDSSGGRPLHSNYQHNRRC